MSVCAVRTIKWLVSEKIDVLAIYSHPNYWLPHEPKSEHRFAMRLLDGEALSLLVSNWIGTYTECKHCGSIYSAGEGE